MTETVETFDIKATRVKYLLNSVFCDPAVLYKLSSPLKVYIKTHYREEEVNYLVCSSGLYSDKTCTSAFLVNEDGELFGDRSNEQGRWMPRLQFEDARLIDSEITGVSHERCLAKIKVELVYS